MVVLEFLASIILIILGTIIAIVLFVVIAVVALGAAIFILVMFGGIFLIGLGIWAGESGYPALGWLIAIPGVIWTAVIILMGVSGNNPATHISGFFKSD